MARICRTCGEPVRDGFYCGCGVNKDAVESFVSKRDDGRKVPSPGPKAGVSVPSSGDGAAPIEPQAGAPMPSSSSTGDDAGAEIATIKGRIADLKAEVKRIEGEIDGLFRQRKSTSSLEWYLFAIDHSNGANDPDDPRCPRGLPLHLLTWGFFGFVWIPFGYALWLTGRSERAAWDLAQVRQTNRKVNDQIKVLRNRRTSLLAELDELKSRLKEIAGKDYSPTWQDHPTGAATTAINGAVRETTSGVGRIVKGVINAVPAKTCPKCHSNWAKEPDGEEVVETKFISGLSAPGGDGVERDFCGFVTKVVQYEQRYKCRKCSHRWSVRKVRRTSHQDLCPACYRHGTTELTRTEEIGTVDHCKTEVVMDAVHVDRNKELVGATYREVSVPVRTVRLRHFYHCKACDRGWTTASTKTFRT